ncbi:tRNA (adenine-N1)-methyltransferase [Acidithrix ferrooxidans]|uniref:tRNA (adenine(58)-N(1))-methyltransferase TrmI n=1 Tax=Acidithrix ferrooxidans TaxID=1280514 RepID=A0A0D8HDB0_9ACTN|nr:tRNA (adenine-N1)-methyltransferase [Acidithrix ferrooxidans]KJF15935.1 tRNA (adenine(58)-N(1))-methyltransferase TrmI [Acidithrix ferrooxidans]
MNPENDEYRFRDGERVLLIDERRRSQFIDLGQGKKSSTHHGSIVHDELIGQLPGFRLFSSKGKAFRAVRPTMAEAIAGMPRGAQVIYPKDLGQILMMADIGQGSRVLESGVGSGALSMALLNAGAIVTGYEIRQDFANRAWNNVQSYLGPSALSRYTVKIADAYTAIEDGPFDRVVLDLPEPWRVLEHLHGKLVPGGIVLAYQTSVGQLEQFRSSLNVNGFFLGETLEVFVREWYHSSSALRPDHRMVAHTGFLTKARILGDFVKPIEIDGAVLLEDHFVPSPQE